MKKSPWEFDVVAVTSGDPVPEGFAKMKIYKECRSLLGEMILVQAADAHPSWERTGHDTFSCRASTGPTTVETLKAWFESNHPERVKNMAEAIRKAVHVKHGIKPPKMS